MQALMDLLLSPPDPSSHLHLSREQKGPIESHGGRWQVPDFVSSYGPQPWDLPCPCTHIA